MSPDPTLLMLSLIPGGDRLRDVRLLEKSSGDGRTSPAGLAFIVYLLLRQPFRHCSASALIGAAFWLAIRQGW